MAKVTKTSPDPPSILQKLANMYNWRENLAENIDPFGYSKYDEQSENPWSPVKRLYNAIVLDKDENAGNEDCDVDDEIFDEINQIRN